MYVSFDLELILRTSWNFMYTFFCILKIVGSEFNMTNIYVYDRPIWGYNITHAAFSAKFLEI